MHPCKILLLKDVERKPFIPNLCFIYTEQLMTLPSLINKQCTGNGLLSHNSGIQCTALLSCVYHNTEHLHQH